MRCHLVYAVPLSSRTFKARVLNRLRLMLGDMGLPVGPLSNRHPGAADFQSWPIRSPYENTKNLYLALSRIMPTSVYHLAERTHCRLGKDDIFLGHPYFPYQEGKYGVTEMAVNGKTRPRVLALITPLHCEISVDNPHINKDFLLAVDKLIPKIDVLFGIMGEYWWDRWDHSPFAHWKPKMIRLDMAVDTKNYPFVKEKFNKPGHRGYLYIGSSSDPRKGTNFLSCVMGKLKDYPKAWIGDGPEIKNVKRLSKGRSLDPAFMREVAKDYDFFISPSVADPNPTTILESMAWGFPVVCTQQSGYYETEYMKNIYLDDVEKSTRILESLQHLDDASLSGMAKKGRKAAQQKYNWDNFTDTIIKTLGLSSISC